MLGSTKTTRQRRQRVYRVHLTWAAQRKHPHGQMRSVPRAPAATATRAPPRVASAPHASSAATASASASAGGSASGLVMPAARSIASTMETTCVVTAKLAGTFPVDHNAKLQTRTANDDGVSEELRSVRAERQGKLSSLKRLKLHAEASPKLQTPMFFHVEKCSFTATIPWWYCIRESEWRRRREGSGGRWRPPS